MKIIYDYEEPNQDKRVYIEESNGNKTYMLFYDIKLDTGDIISRFKRWPNQQVRIKYYKDATNRDEE